MRHQINIILLFFLFVGSFHLYAQNQTPDSLLVSYQKAKTDSAELESLRQILNYWKFHTSDSTIFYAKKLIKKSVEADQISKAYKGYYWICSSMSNLMYSDSTIYYAFQGLDLFQSDTAYFYPQTVLLLFIGEEYRSMEKFEEALKYLRLSWDLSLKSDRPETLIGIANRMAACYHESREHELALYWVDSSLKLAEVQNSSTYVMKSWDIKASVLRDQGKLAEALEIFKISLDNTDDEIMKIGILNNIASTYIKLEDNENTIKYALASFEMSEKLDFPTYSVVSAEFLASAYNERGDYQKAFEYLRRYEQIRHELFFGERDAQIAKLNAQYENQKKETQIEQQKAVLNQKDWELKAKNIILISTIVVLLIVLLFSVNLYLARKRLKLAHALLLSRNEKIESQKSEIEAKAQEIEIAYYKLKELDIQKQAFIHMLVHDLKNPLNLLVNLDVFEDEEERNTLINRSSKQMLNMVMNILDVSASEERELQVAPKVVSALDLISSAIRDVDFLCIPRNIEIIYQNDYDYLIKADYELMNRVFVNLLTNAIKFSSRNDQIIIDAKELDNGKLKIEVIDHGPGIDPKYQKLIFEKFKQVQVLHSAKVGSTGLGLAFCKVAVEAHGWEIGISSQVGEGSAFWMIIDEFKALKKE